MSGEINNQTEQYQRGQVLGFTMAEIMLVLIFLLLLLLGTKIQKTQDKLNAAYSADSPEYKVAVQVKETLKELKTIGVIPEDKDLLWLTEILILSAEEVIKAPKNDTDIIQNLEDEILSLKTELALQKTINKQSGVSTLKEKIEQLTSQLKKEQQKQKINLSNAATGKFFTGILEDQDISSAEAKQCLLTCGGGPKACWGESLENPDFIYNIALYDEHIYVTSDKKSINKNNTDWMSLPDSARVEQGIKLSNQQFNTNFSILYQHAQSNDCVFQVRLFDYKTSSKEIYKEQLQMVDRYVYTTKYKGWTYGDLPN